VASESPAHDPFLARSAGLINGRATENLRTPQDHACAVLRADSGLASSMRITGTDMKSIGYRSSTHAANGPADPHAGRNRMNKVVRDGGSIRTEVLVQQLGVNIDQKASSVLGYQCMSCLRRNIKL